MSILGALGYMGSAISGAIANILPIREVEVHKPIVEVSLACEQAKDIKPNNDINYLIKESHCILCDIVQKNRYVDKQEEFSNLQRMHDDLMTWIDIVKRREIIEKLNDYRYNVFHEEDILNDEYFIKYRELTIEIARQLRDQSS
jgi:formate dehydrogenase assembly factor FdhD